ncbi:hypothetical protein C3387_15175 [Leclercia sp. LSNIH6]|uniref:hypothetical protein n=1 Tax=Leclercia TaxID=83654 RepID=UPI000CDD7E31|nr:MULTISPECIES: hypothetical protein [Leclercia]POU76822.1 hypothetical protein C3387_15175 [Leclercia sp. LSNIH6]POW52241.1 hypothetical protein C3406_11485 [Leclercia sp. LSNIH8]WNY87560.1 hypothetical protein NRF19_24125 [Leclercia adecarboxylata]
MKLKAVAVACICAVSLSACCTIVDGTKQKVAINTDAPALFSVRNADGMEVAKGIAPTTVNLKRGDAPYHVEVRRTETSPVTRGDINDSSNGWMWGNILFGGLIGIGVDHFDGASRELDKQITLVTMKDPNHPEQNANDFQHVSALGEVPVTPVTINNTINNKQG